MASRPIWYWTVDDEDAAAGFGRLGTRTGSSSSAKTSLLAGLKPTEEMYDCKGTNPDEVGIVVVSWDVEV